MQITFLGTSSGAPTRQRNLSATAIQPELGRHWVLVDCGEATQHQLQHTRLSPQKLSAILITHIHGDHCYGLPGLLASCQLSGRTEPLLLIGPQAVWDYLQAVIRFTEMRIDYELEFIATDNHVKAERGGFRITAWPLSHRVPCWGYRLEELGIPLRLDVDKLHAEGIDAGPGYAQLQRGEDLRLDDGRLLRSTDYTTLSRAPRSVVIGGDNDRPELLAEPCQSANLLIHEATYSEAVLQQVGPEPQHSSAARVAAFAEQVGLPALILTHFSPRYRLHPRHAREHSIKELQVEARQHYAGSLFLAQDLDRYRIARNGDVTHCGSRS